MASKPTEILIVDDEPEICEILRAALADRNSRCTTAQSGREAYTLLTRRPFDVILSDIAMPGMDGLELLDKARELRPEVKVILITGYGSLAWAKQAIRRGAFEYLEKPFDLHEIQELVEQARTALAAEVHARRKHEWPADAPQRDGLTGLLNHRYFCEELSRLRALCRRQHHTLSVLLIDVDRFGQINVEYGHATGDLVLRELAGRWLEASRSSDLVARYGWDQFVIALPETSADAALALAERCRKAVCDQPVSIAEQPIACTISIGVAECDTGFIEPEADLLRRAEDALAHAKVLGGDRVTGWQGVTSYGRFVPCDPIRGDLAPRSNRLCADERSVQRMSEQFRSLQGQLRQTCFEFTLALVAAVEAKEPHTERHSRNVATYCEAIARRMGVAPAMLETLKTAAILHDIGKIGVPDSVLSKAGPLTEEEFALIKQHTAMGVHILERVSFLRAELPMVLHHHERWDGLGYPAGLSGTSIPLGARILHVADSMDAMFSKRTYKEGYCLEQVKTELQRGRGTQFDPRVVDAALTWLTECPDEIIYPAQPDCALAAASA